MRLRIYPEYYINEGDKRTQVDRSHFFEELKKSFPNPEEIFRKLEIEDKIVGSGNKYFFVRKKGTKK